MTQDAEGRLRALMAEVEELAPSLSDSSLGAAASRLAHIVAVRRALASNGGADRSVGNGPEPASSSLRPRHVSRLMTAPDGMALCHLLNLDDDLLLSIARRALAADLPSGLRLLRLSRGACDRLRRYLRALANDSRLTWIVELTSPSATPAITAGGSTLVYTAGGVWSCCKSLPVTGVSSWSIRICEDSLCAGAFVVGIGMSDASGMHGWGLDVRNDCFRRLFRHADWSKDALLPQSPEGYPHVAADHFGGPPLNVVPWNHEAGIDSDPYYQAATGLHVNLRWDADEGTFTIGCASEERSLRGFPKAAVMRPWALLYGGLGDCLSIHGWTAGHE